MVEFIREQSDWRNIRVPPFASLVVCLLAGAAVLAASVLAAPVAGAEYPVGFRVIEKRDATRSQKDAPGGRPVPIALWYPAKAALGTGAPRMRYRDYVMLGLSEKTLAPPEPAAVEQMLAEYRKFLGATGVEPSDADSLLATPLRAVRDAPSAGDGFPLVLLAPGNAQSADDMAALGEALAARGFLAASVPSPTRISGPMQSEADIPDKADEQATDLAFARHALSRQAREGRFGVVGHSFGARSAVLLAMRDAEAAGIVSLDGGIGSKTGAGMLEKSRGFSRERMRAPLLHFYEELDPQMAPDFALIRSLDRADRWLVRTEGLHHIHFTTIGDLVEGSPALFRATSATGETRAAWAAVLAATESFLAECLAPAEAGAGAEPWQVPASRELRVEKLPASRAGASSPR